MHSSTIKIHSRSTGTHNHNVSIIHLFFTLIQCAVDAYGKIYSRVGYFSLQIKDCLNFFFIFFKVISYSKTLVYIFLTFRIALFIQQRTIWDKWNKNWKKNFLFCLQKFSDKYTSVYEKLLWTMFFCFAFFVLYCSHLKINQLKKLFIYTHTSIKVGEL
jgi:hypothetical protein